MGPTKFVQMMIQRWTLTYITSRSNLLPNYHKVPYDCDYQNKPINRSRERSDSVVECLTRDPSDGSSSLTGITGSLCCVLEQDTFIIA